MSAFVQSNASWTRKCIGIGRAAALEKYAPTASNEKESRDNCPDPLRCVIVLEMCCGFSPPHPP